MKYVLRVLAIIGVAVGILVIGIIVALSVVMKGPSRHAAELLTMSLKETSALYWIPTLYFSDEEIARIVENNTVKDSNEKIDTSMVDTAKNEGSKDIEVLQISGSTYVGDVMIIKDPSRVFVGNKGDYDGSEGATVDVIAARYGAIGGINGGGFLDENGQGNGGTPDGFVISQGEVSHVPYGDYYAYYSAVGFDSNNNMIIGTMSAQDAINMGLRDCVCVQTTYAPVLIVNGYEQEVMGYGGGLNPRTAIGQRADGAVLFVTVDGRQANSVGASFADMVKIMLDLGAVNAASLDGGSSSSMWYNGEFLNTPYALSGARVVPNAFLVW